METLLGKTKVIRNCRILESFFEVISVKSNNYEEIL